MVLNATLGTPICPWLPSTLVMGKAVEPNLWEGPVLDQHRGRTQASQLVQRDKGYREGKTRENQNNWLTFRLRTNLEAEYRKPMVRTNPNDFEPKTPCNLLKTLGGNVN